MNTTKQLTDAALLTDSRYATAPPIRGRCAQVTHGPPQGRACRESAVQPHFGAQNAAGTAEPPAFQNRPCRGVD